MLKKLIVVLALLPAMAFAQADARLDLEGTPSFIALDANSLVLGTAGAGMLVVDLPSSSARLSTSNPANGSAATTVAGSGTIDTTKMWQRITDAGAITGVIMEAGTINGQIVIVSVDKDASGSVTMAAEATSNVCSGTASVITAGAGRIFIWDATDTCWAELGET